MARHGRRDPSEGRAPRDVSLIFLFLHGGLSTIDTWDMKPNAPAEFRGEFTPIKTNVPGVEVCEHLPKMAKVMDKLSLVRSFRHPIGNHEQAISHVLTGGTDTNGQALVGFSMGSMYARIRGTNHEAEIGKTDSHGCVRMRNVDVAEMYELVVVGTQVLIAS